MPSFVRRLSPARRAIARASVFLALSVAALCGASVAAAQNDDRPVTSGGRTVGIEPRTDPGERKPVPGDRSAITPEGKVGALAAQSVLLFTIDVRWLGSTSYRMERDVATPIERAVKTLPGVKDVHSSIVGSRVQTQVAFDARTDASTTAAAIRNRLDQIKSRLPHTASQPLIAWQRSTDPIKR